jgi:hypothetical protein
MSKLKAFEVTEYKPYTVYAETAEQAIEKFYNYDYVEEGDIGNTVRELGVAMPDGVVEYF